MSEALAGRVEPYESAEVEDDETAYLLRSPANRERLLKAMENVANGRDLVTVDVGELQ